MNAKIVSVLLGGLWITASLLMAGWSHSPSDDFYQDEQKMTRFADEIMNGDYSVNLKYGSSYQTYRNLREFANLGEQLSRSLQLPSGSTGPDFDQHPLYQTQATSPEGVQVLLRLVGMNDDRADSDDGAAHSTYMMLSLEGERQNTLSAIESWRIALDRKLQALGFAPDWNINLQGEARFTEDPARELRELASSELQAQPVGETYEDLHSSSATYDSPVLHRRLQAGSRFIRLQTALHQESIHHRWRVTLGSPMITIEY